MAVSKDPPHGGKGFGLQRRCSTRRDIALDHSFSNTVFLALEQKTAPATMYEAHTPQWHQAQIANCVDRLTSPYLSREGRELWQSYLKLHKQKLRELA